jgi:transposase
MRGTAEAQTQVWDTDALCGNLIDEDGFLATLGRARGTLFTDSDFDPLYPSARGRPSHPPSVLAALLLAQLFYGVSDREAERRSRLDLSWKAALGLPLNHRGIPHVCLAEFRARLLRAGMEGFLHAKLLQVAAQAGVVGTRRAVDSTGIRDSVVTQDTVTLIRQALRRCLRRLGNVAPDRATVLGGRLHRDDYEAQGKPQILWSDPEARAALLAELFADAQATIEACRAEEDAELEAAALLLAAVAGQDLEVEEGREDGPKVSIRRGVAPERIISVVDPEARHGHRSRSDRYDGYKVHLSADLDSDLITAAEATVATAGDGAVLPRLLDAEPGKVEEVVADTAYGSGRTREEMAERDIELIAPAPPPVAPGGRFTKADFTIDLQARTATCPAGHTVSPRRYRTKRQGPKRVQFRFPADLCRACPLRASCTTSPRGRVIDVGPHEALLQQARAERWTESFRVRYGVRARVERKAAQVKFRSPKIPWRGLVKAAAWAKLKVAALNLDRLGRLGLVPA